VESVTVTLNVEDAESADVPEIAPFEEFRVSPEGSAPELIDHV
jgi:hypothetical protein